MSPTINHSTRELTAKIVYYGPGLCGKTTNLQYIHDTLPPEKRSKMLSLATESDRTLFFDLLPIDLGTVNGFKIKLQLYTVPGQVFYNETRKIVLKGADGIVFVADSQREMLDANLESLKNLKENLQVNKLEFKEMPHVLQYNKRDLKNALPVSELDAALNVMEAPTVEAAAKSGAGVHETLKAVSRLVLSQLIDRYGTDREKKQHKDKVKAAPVVTKIKLGSAMTPPPGADAGGTVTMMSPFAAAKTTTAEVPEGGTVAMVSPFAQKKPAAEAPPEGATVALMSPFAQKSPAPADAPEGATVALMSPFAAAKKTTGAVPAAPKPPSAEPGGTVAMMSPFAQQEKAIDAPNLLEASGEFRADQEAPSLDSLVQEDPTVTAPRIAPQVEELGAETEIEPLSSAPAPKSAPAKTAGKAFEQLAAAASPKKMRESGSMAKVTPAAQSAALKTQTAEINLPPVSLSPDTPQMLEVPIEIGGKKGKLHLLLTVELDD